MTGVREFEEDVVSQYPRERWGVDPGSYPRGGVEFVYYPSDMKDPSNAKWVKCDS